MKILGIDFGTKRVGIAVSDEGAKVAFPVEVIPNTAALVQKIKKTASYNGVKKIVIGESRNYKGEPNAIFEEAERLRSALEKEGFETDTEPEFMTSIEAERLQGKNDKLDASAAAVMLQSYLNKMAGRTSGSE